MFRAHSANRLYVCKRLYVQSHYWLSQNKITVEQRDQYGQTNQLELSFKDGADLFDFAYSSDGGFSAGIDQEGIDIVRDKILPFFASD